MKITTFLLFSCAVLSISACQNTTIVNKPITPTVLSSQQFNEILQQHTWTYTPPNSEIPIQINFNNESIAIYSGCNLMSRKYKTQDHQIMLFDYLLSSTKACGELEKQESLTYGLFLQPHSFTLEQNPKNEMVLKLEHSNHQHYIFKAKPKKEDLEQSDLEVLTKFTWQHITDDQNQVQKQALLLNFDPDRVRYYSGCNRNYYKYSIENNTIFHLGHYGGTVMMCPINLQEKQFEKLSAKPFHFKFDYSTTFPKLILESKYQPNMIFQATPRKEDLKLP